MSYSLSGMYIFQIYHSVLHVVKTAYTKRKRRISSFILIYCEETTEKDSLLG